MGIGADENDAGLAETELGAGDVKNALAIVPPAEPRDAIFGRIRLQQFEHVADLWIRHGVEATLARRRIGGNVVIGESENLIRMRHRQAAFMQSVERVSRALMNKATVDIKKSFVFLLGDNVVIPHLGEQCSHRTQFLFMPAKADYIILSGNSW